MVHGDSPANVANDEENRTNDEENRICPKLH